MASQGDAVTGLPLPGPWPTRCFYSRYLQDMAQSSNIMRFVIRIPLMSSLAILGLVGNVLSFVVLGKEMRATSTSFILRSLAVVDNTILMTYALYFSFPTVYTVTGQMVDYFEFHQYFNRYLWGILWFCKTMGIYLVVFVTTERFIAVRLPLKAKILCTVRNARISVACLCVFSFAYNLPKIFLMDVGYAYDPCSPGQPKPVTILTPLNFNPYFESIYTYGLWYLLIVFVPWGMIIVMNSVMLWCLRRSAQGNLGSDQGKRARETKAITVRVMAVSVVFLLLEMPQVIANIIWALAIVTGLAQSQEQNVLDIRLLHNVLGNTYFLSTVNSFINFYVYCVTGKNFRYTLKKMFKCCKRLS
ncbi:FMRFamide receptor-like [Lineus longissimus]|uniref:FMRFamide receptor-like n=1 Tax=Lineus longissimus TaxID=88925 RepID=UPI002B4EFE71